MSVAYFDQSTQKPNDIINKEMLTVDFVSRNRESKLKPKNARMSMGFELGFMFCMKSENSIDPSIFKPFFVNLPVDPNIKTFHRFRRLSKFKITGDGIIKVPNGYFVQGCDYNPLLGEVKRQFESLDDDLVRLDTFQSLLCMFRDFCTLRPGADIGVHQIRTTCSAKSIGEVVPEGIHQDGVDFVCIYVVDRSNIEGAETYIYTNKQGDSSIFNKILDPGDLVMLNDRKFYHYTSAVQPASIGNGSRDVFILTHPSLMAEV